MTQGKNLSWTDGAHALGDGFGFLVRRPKLALLGAVPPALTSILLFAALVGLLLGSDDLATAFTPFADGWATTARQVLRALVGFLIVLIGAVLSVLWFVAITLAVGTPIYDRLSEELDTASGGIAGRVEYPASEQLRRVLGQTLRTMGQSLLLSLGLFAVGLVPMVGSFSAAVLGALGGGWMIARELVGGPLERRGLPRLRDRSVFLGAHRQVTFGFGVPVYLLMLVPVVAIFVFPAATVGAAILVRRLRGEPVA